MYVRDILYFTVRHDGILNNPFLRIAFMEIFANTQTDRSPACIDTEMLEEVTGGFYQILTPDHFTIIRDVVTRTPVITPVGVYRLPWFQLRH